MRQKKNEQINKLMKDSSEDEADIRGWIQKVADEASNSEERE